MTDYLEEATKIENTIIAWRRDFHKNPELSFKEVRTAGIVATELDRLGFIVTENVGLTGIVGLLEGKYPGPCILLRFDMDALPMQEDNQSDYASVVPNVMHACGHDTHVAMGLGVAAIMASHCNEIHGSLKFMFQPAEENGSGAKAMIEDGLFESPRPDLAFAIHIHSQTPSGIFGITDGPVLSAADTFRCVITGKGGHGAEPQATIDPVLTGAHIITQIQTIVSRNVNPFESASISIGSIHAGSAYNIIPEVVEIQGSIRTYSAATRELVHRRLREIVEGTCQAMGAKADLEINTLIPPTVNTPRIAEKVREIAAHTFGPESVDANNRSTASEDFSLVLQEIPGVYITLGAARRPNDYPHHNPLFDVNEAMMKNGVALLCEIAAYYLIGEIKRD